MRFPTLTSALALVALAIAIGSVVALWIRPQPISAAAPAAVPMRQITVVGQGEAKATPDTAMVQIGVQTEALTARQALTDNNTKMTALIAKLKELGVGDKDIQTSNISIYPRYDHEGREVVGYQVGNMVSVKIRNVGQTGALLDQVVEAGANNLSGITFMIDDAKALEQQARDQAIANARTRAEAMAKAAGATVGQVYSITENIGTPPPMPMPMAAAREMATDASVPVEAGEQTITAQVQITFELQ
jgi:hypothetical protein